MDTTDINIRFDEQGICNYCREAIELLPRYKFSCEEENRNLDFIVSKIKKNKKGKYDCIIGLSGVDSSFAA